MIIEGQAGISLGYRFWSRLAEEMANLVGIEIASFNRYYTIEVARTIIDSGRANEIALYTGNDDNIINDLLTTYKSENKMDKYIEANIVGGLLSHWAAWTRRSVEIYRPIKKIKEEKKEILRELLMLNLHVTTEQALTFGFLQGFQRVI
jgi:hypothetical protein